ncbi:CDP-glycerol glycerophosphotransferase family protein [Ruminococcus sp.]|uniref:bifunctional glycosyltransferase/CDP-glycerol:glycerophosphate glycerophosphotransferase n=1 Tax=Ruminococcus sp. TaxID=41978 RepID=UPI00388F7716
MSVSVIVPYLETSDLIQRTADSVKSQRRAAADVELLVADISEEQSAEAMLSGYRFVRVVKNPKLHTEAEAYNLALKHLKADYAVVARPGDEFGSGYFMNALAVMDEDKPYDFAAPQRFCINPVYTRYKYICRTNVPEKHREMIADIRHYPNLLQMELDGNLIRGEVLKQYPADPSLPFEFFHDVMLRLQKDHPVYYAMGLAEFNTFMPLSDDSAYFVPSNHIEWYRESVEGFLLPLAERFKNPDGSLPLFIQFYLMYAVSARFLANMNNRNKRNMSEEELERFFQSCKKVLDLLNDTIILNAGKYKALGYSEEAAEMFYMLKYDTNLYEMPQHLSEGNEDVTLDCNDVIVTRLQGQRVGLHVLDYSDGKVMLDGSFRQVFNLNNLELYAVWNGERVELIDNDRYSLTKYFGISAYKKYTFHLDLVIDDSLAYQKLSFFARYRSTRVPLQFSYLHHWAKFAGSPLGGYWRFNKYMATIVDNRNLIVEPASKGKTIKRELRYLPNVFAESKRSFITRLQYWLTRPFYKNKRIWLMYDKLYKGGDSCEYLYRYCKDKKDGITRYYIIDKNTSDYRQMKRDGLHPVKTGSLKHKMAFLNADIALITNSQTFPFNGYSMDKSRFIRDLCNFPTMCLQHGLSVQKCAMAQQRIIDNTRMYFIASKYEEMNLNNHVYGYKDTGILKMTGIGRYDGLISNDQKQILITPTWRMYNAMPVTTSEGEQRSYNPDFKNTVYYRIYNDLINNQKLIETAKRTGYKIKYLLHPILSAQVDDYTPDPYVEVISSVGDMSYEQILTESSLMVTDYSGVQFDFAYMKKPLVYFHPDELPAHYDDGGFFYDTMGFGEICTTSPMLVDTLCEYMENGCRMKPEYIARVDDFYHYDDHDNCRRIYDEIMKFQQQVDKDKLR